MNRLANTDDVKATVDSSSSKPTRLVRYPEIEIKFITESSEYILRQEANSKSGKVVTPTNEFLSQSVLSVTTKNAFEDDTAVFSVLLSGDIYWDKIVASNDAIVLKITPDTKRPQAEKDKVANVILVGLISEVKQEGNYSEDAKTYRITGKSFAKSLIDFKLGVIQQVSVVLSELGWLPDDTGSGTQFSGKNASTIAKTMLERFIPYMKYHFSDNKGVKDFLDYTNLDSWTEFEYLVDPTPFVNYEGSLKQLLDDITEKPFNELYFEFTQDEKCAMIMRRSPFDEQDWYNVPANVVNSNAVVTEAISKSDNEVASIYNVVVDNVLGMDSVDMLAFPRYFPELVEKYGYNKLEVSNRYLTGVGNSVSSGSGDDTDSSNLDQAPSGQKISVTATAYSLNQPGMSNLTANGTDLREHPKVIAVDPSVIKLGTTVWVEGFGYYLAGDTGSAIKGTRIDIHMTNLADAKKFGKKDLKVVIPDNSTSTAEGNSNRKVNTNTVGGLTQNINNSLTKYAFNDLRVNKSAVAGEITAHDNRITRDMANEIVDYYLAHKSFKVQQLKDITGINENNINQENKSKASYSKVKKFLKDYSDKGIKDKELVVTALLNQYGTTMTRDQSVDIATLYLKNKKIEKDAYKTIMTNSASGENTQDVNSEALKLFTTKLANWYCENPNFYSGEYVVVGNPDYKLGNRFLYMDLQDNNLWEFYIEGVQHNFNYSDGYTTNLTVTRGLPNGGDSRFTNLWGNSEEFRGGLLGEQSLQDLWEEGMSSRGTVNTNGTGGSFSSGDSGSDPGGASSAQLEKAIQWYKDRLGKVRYSMGENGPRTGPDSYDCSSAVYASFIYAGILPKGTYLGSTEDLYALDGKLFTEIDRKAVKRGDIFIAGGKGTSAGPNGHAGLFLSNNQIIHCNYSAGTISITPADGYMARQGATINFYRVKGQKSSNSDSGGGGGAF